MPGARSVYFDNESEEIVRDFMDENHHGKFSQALRALIKNFRSMQKANGEYRKQNWELQQRVSILEKVE